MVHLYGYLYGWLAMLAMRHPRVTLLWRAFPLWPVLARATDPNAAQIGSFFSRLTADVSVFSLAMAGFFFSLSALFYMSSGLTGNERNRQHAIGCLYAALTGLALAGLAGAFSALIGNAASGATAGGPNS